LCDQCEWQLVLFVTKRARNLLKERFIAAMIVDPGLDTSRFTLQAKLGGRIKHTLHSFFRQIVERPLTTTRPRQRDIRPKRVWQRRRIDADLRYISIGSGSREKFALALVDENVEHSFIECRIDRMPMCFPIAIGEIDLDTTTKQLGIVHANSCVAKIWTCFPIPGSELHDINFVASS
jgi:hypothetical protein